MPPFIYYHIDPFSILVVIEHRTFTSVFSTTHVLLSIDFTSALAEVSSPTEQLLDRPLGDAPAGREHPIMRSPPATDHAHTKWGDKIQGGPEGQVFPGIVTDIPNSVTYCQAILFAEDTTVYLTEDNLQTMHDKVNTDVYILNDWFGANQLSVSPSKTK